MTAEPPALYLPLDGKLRVLLPPSGCYAPSGREWLRRVCGAGTRVESERQPRVVWLVARRHFRTLLDVVPRRHGPTAVTVDRRRRHRCDVRCREARVMPPEECECACLGRHHGDGWTGIPWEQADTRLIADEVTRMTWTQYPAARRLAS